MRWDDIATVAAVVRAGSFLRAARELAVQHSSISRRVASLEDGLGELLFRRGRQLVPTALAREIALHAADMSAAARRIESSLSARRARRAAEIVVTTNDALAALLFRALAGCAISSKVRVIVTDTERDLEPGATDLALRPTGAPQRALRGRRLGVLAVGVVQARSLRAADGAPWVLPSAELRGRSSMRWLRSVPEGVPAAVECDRILALRDACAAGLGRAVLPTFLAADDARLEVVRTLDDGIPLWLFVAGSRRQSARLEPAIEQLTRALRRQPATWAAP
jgi:DNA-binding transcriptional LysR family regulator